MPGYPPKAGFHAPCSRSPPFALDPAHAALKKTARPGKIPAGLETDTLGGEGGSAALRQIVTTGQGDKLVQKQHQEERSAQKNQAVNR